VNKEEDPVTPATDARRVDPPGRESLKRELRARLMKFAVPFGAVAGYYLVGVMTFAIMASSDAADNGGLSFFIGYALQRTGPFALVSALAAGYWWR
jgi:hypothetical protein